MSTARIRTHLLKHVKPYRSTKIPQLRRKKFIRKSCRVREKFSQGDLAGLIDKGSIVLQDLNLRQFRTQFVHLLVVIELQDSLLDSLHADDGGEKLGAGCNPEDRVHGHRLGGVQTFLYDL